MDASVRPRSMNLVYFAHSYRSVDAPIVDFFAELLRTEGLLPALDPPSDSVNAARLERHLRESDGMVVVLTRRDESVSPHIRFEMSLALRARIPLLVFIEDTLKFDVPQRLLQRRFSRTSFFRQAREHRHAVQILKSYIGDTPPPRYQPLMQRRSCLFAGTAALPDPVRDDLMQFVDARGYEPHDLRGQSEATFYEAVSSADVCVRFLDDDSPEARFAMGSVVTAFVPSIVMTQAVPDSPDDWIPSEYGPSRLEVLTDSALVSSTITDQLDIFEKDFIELDDPEAATRYAEFLVALGVTGGDYAATTREAAVEVVMGDRYEVHGQTVMGVGPAAHVHDVSVNQAWTQIEGQVPLDELRDELEKLRLALRDRAGSPEEDIAVAQVAEAQIAADAGDGPGALARLREAGKWALGVAQDVGVPIAVAALKAALGLP